MAKVPQKPTDPPRNYIVYFRNHTLGGTVPEVNAHYQDCERKLTTIVRGINGVMLHPVLPTVQTMAVVSCDSEVARQALAEQLTQQNLGTLERQVQVGTPEDRGAKP